MQLGGVRRSETLACIHSRCILTHLHPIESFVIRQVHANHSISPWTVLDMMRVTGQNYPQKNSFDVGVRFPALILGTAARPSAIPLST